MGKKVKEWSDDEGESVYQSSCSRYEHGKRIKAYQSQQQQLDRLMSKIGEMKHELPEQCFVAQNKEAIDSFFVYLKSTLSNISSQLRIDN